MSDLRQPQLVWVYDLDDVQIGPVHDLVDVITEIKLGSEETFNFQIRRDDPKFGWLGPEQMIRWDNKYWRIDQFVDERADNSPALISTIRTVALWYDLANYVRFGNFPLLGKTPAQGVELILEDTGWTFGTSEVPDTIHSYEVEDASALELLRNWALVCQAEIEFDTVNKEVNFLESLGTDEGIGFRWGKNVSTIKRTYDPVQATRVWPVGANELGIAGVSVDGKPYVENFSWYTDQGIPLVDAQAKYLKEFIWKDDSYLLALDLYDAATAKLAQLSQPLISYEATVVDLSNLTGVAEDSYTIGDLVRVYDSGLDIDILTRVVRLVKHPYEPWNNEIELSYYRPGLSLESLLGTGNSGGGRSDFQLLVDENAHIVVTASVSYVNIIDFTVAGSSSAIIGAHAIGTTAGVGTLDYYLLLDGTRLGGRGKIPFVPGDTINIGFSDFYASIEEGDHELALVMVVMDALGGVVEFLEFESRLSLMGTGILGGLGGGGPAHITTGDTVDDYTMTLTDSTDVDLLSDLGGSGSSETLADETDAPTDSPPTIVVV